MCTHTKHPEDAGFGVTAQTFLPKTIMTSKQTG